MSSDDHLAISRQQSVRGRLVNALLVLDRVVERCSLFLASIALATAVSVGLHQVLSRFVLHEPAAWSEVTTRTLIIWSVFLGLPAAIRRGSLLSVDLLYRKIAATKHLIWLRAALSLATAAFLISLVTSGIAIAQRLHFQVLAGLDLSIAYGYAAIPVGCSLALVALAADLVDPRRSEMMVD